MNNTTDKNETIFLKVDFKPITFIYVIDILMKLSWCYLYFTDRISVWLFLGALLCIVFIEWLIYTKIETKYRSQLTNKIGDQRLVKFSYISIDFATRETFAGIYGIIGLIVSFWFFIKIISPEHWYTYILIAIPGLIGTILFIVQTQNVLYPKSFHPFRFAAMKTTVTAGATSSDKSEVPQTTTINVSHQYISELAEIERLFNQNIYIDEMDVNDTEIARLESDLKSVNSRVDSYILESVLIGSLTFSGFLTIIASGLVKPIHLNQLNFLALSSLFSTNVKTSLMGLDQWATAERLFPLIMVESLLCSVFFILVLALRMRFSQLSLKMDYLLRIMTIFNAKEEELINLELSVDFEHSQKYTSRRRNLSYKISEAINDANKLSKDIKPLANMMALYRNIGLILFFTILITSGLFFSAQVAISIFFFAIATWVFRVIDSWRSLENIKRLIQRH